MEEDQAKPKEDTKLRLERLRKLVQSGKYEVPADKIAARLIDLSTTLRQD